MTKRQYDGGPAFPVAEGHKVAADLPWTCGMTLRDYFAAKALTGLLACTADEDYRDQALRSDDYPAYCLEYAESAYEMADAMLKARNA